jgi:hypothetical protein
MNALRRRPPVLGPVNVTLFARDVLPRLREIAPVAVG